MTNNDFKTAAAKLLAQHAAKIRVTATAATVDNNTKNTSILTPLSENYTVAPFSLQVKILITLSLVLLGCAIMVFLVPETIFGIAGNIGFGILSGVILGAIFTRM